MRTHALIASMVVFTLSGFLCITSCKKPAVESKPIDANSEPVALEASHYGRHLLTPWYPLRLSGAEWNKLNHLKPCGGLDSLSFEFIVSEAGMVRSARYIPEEISCEKGHLPQTLPPFLSTHLKEANALNSSVRFRPWIINGRPSSVRFLASLPLAPPERFGPSRPFPISIDLSSITIGLERRGCEGLCPAYKVLLKADGTVFYQGGAYVAVSGTQTAHVPATEIAVLLEQFRKANFLTALPTYSGAQDGGDSLLTLSLNGTTYTVEDESGLLVGMPDSILTLESAVDEAAESNRWVNGSTDLNLAFLNPNQHLY